MIFTSKVMKIATLMFVLLQVSFFILYVNLIVPVHVLKPISISITLVFVAVGVLRWRKV